jgi:pyruvate dehydrogenase E2 component (dihydrolipoamide acetyltransferase)
MTVELIIPKLGMTMKEATITAWAKPEGDWVEKGEVVFEIQTEKVNYEVEATGPGYLRILEPVGATLPINATVGLLFEERADYEAEAAAGTSAAAPEDDETGPAAETISPKGSPTLQEGPEKPDDKIKISPVARRIAKEHGLDPASISGTGPGGRIVKEDVLRAIEEKPAVPDGKIEAPLEEGGETELGKVSLESIPIQGVRRVIFDNMYQSLSQSAQLTLHTDACAEAFIALRKRLSANSQKISFNAILMKISASALRLHPKINVSVEGDVIHVWKQIHIGLAMEANEALIVPVVRNPDRKTIREIDGDITELVLKTKEDRLSPDDFANGTFTISNLGFADIDHFTPIIRPPENAILGVGRIVEKPAVRDGLVVPEARIGLSLTFDHRITDGAPAARFLKTIKEIIEDPLLML